jgi:CHAT domain-containing protein
VLAPSVDLTVDERILLEQLADVSLLLGEGAAADDLLAGLVTQSSAAGNEYAADYVRLKRVHVALARDDLPAALQQLRQLEPRIGALEEVPVTEADLEVWERTRPWRSSIPAGADPCLLDSRLHYTMGSYLASEGRYRHAVVLLRRGEAHARPPAGALAQRAWVPLRLACAVALLEQGLLAESGDALAGLRETIDARSMPGWHVALLETEAKRALLTGQLGLATLHLEEALTICTEGGWPAARLGALLNLAEVRIVLNQVLGAEELLRQAAGLAEALHDRPRRDRAEWLWLIAAARAHVPFGDSDVPPPVASMQGRVPLSAPRRAPQPRAPRARAAPASFLGLVEDRVLEIRCRLGAGSLAEARERLSDLKATAATSDSELVSLDVSSLEAEIAYEAQEHRAAAEILAPLEERLHALDLKPRQWHALRLQGWCAARLGQGPSAQAIHERANQVLREMEASLSAEDAAIFGINKWTDEERALASRLARLVPEGGLRFDAASMWSADVRGRTRGVLHLLQDLDAKSDSRPADAPPSLLPLALRSPWRATLVFIVLPDRVVKITLSWMHLAVRVVPVTRLGLQRVVVRWHQKIDSESQNDLEIRLDELAAALQLDESLDKLPGRVRSLEIVADHSLHGVPFAAVRWRGRHLVDHWPLAMGQHRLKTRSPASGARDRRGGLVVSVKDGGPRVLEQVEPEARSVTAWLDAHGIEPCHLNDAEAQREEILTRLPRAAFLHAACHGTFNPDRPDASGLVLAARDGRPEILSIRDLETLNLHGLVQATLSCCWGADSFVYPGRWIVSLPDVLARRGTGAVLSALWEIEDAAGRSFMERFYEHLAVLPRHRALQQTQQDCVAGCLPAEGDDHAPMAHPAVWAAYRLHGPAASRHLFGWRQRLAPRLARYVSRLCFRVTVAGSV